MESLCKIWKAYDDFKLSVLGGEKTPFHLWGQDDDSIFEQLLYC